MNTEKYMYYDEISAEWKYADLQELAQMDNPGLLVCPIDAAGNPGKQTTYGAISKKLTVDARWEPKPNHSVHKVDCNQLPHTNGTEFNINYSLNYIRYTLAINTFMVFMGVGFAIAAPFVKKPGLAMAISLTTAIIAVTSVYFAAKYTVPKNRK